MIESGQIKRALICSGENGRPLVDHTIKALGSRVDSKNNQAIFANLTIGAGSVAAIVSHKDLVERTPLSIAAIATNTNYNHLCEGDNSGDELAMLDSEAHRNGYRPCENSLEFFSES